MEGRGREFCENVMVSGDIWAGVQRIPSKRKGKDSVRRVKTSSPGRKAESQG